MTMQITHPPTTRDWLIMFGLAFVWGFSFLFIKRAVAIFTPIQVLCWRMTMATLAYLPFAVLYWSKIQWSAWRYYLVVALAGSAIPNLMYAFAQQHVSSSLAGILNALTPLFALIFGGFFFRMHITNFKILGVVMGFAGASLLVFFNGSSAVSGHLGYALMCALATMFYGFNSNVVGSKLRGHHPAAIAAASFMMIGIPFIILLFQTGAVHAAFSQPDGWKGVGYLAFLGIVGTALASIIYFDLIQRTSTIFATSVTFLLPVMSILIGLWEGEPIGWADVVGTMIILGGLYTARK